jgi:hypothetical protein
MSLLNVRANEQNGEEPAVDQQHKVVSHDEWIEARKALLTREKEFSRQREALGLHVRRAGREADAARPVRGP